MRRLGTIALAVVLVLGLAWLVLPTLHGDEDGDGSGSPTSSPSQGAESPPSPDPTLAPPSASAAPRDPVDAEAGVLDRDVPDSGSGDLDVVPGSAEAPGSGEVRTVRVEVERGLDVDLDAFTSFVMTTLTDDRGWGSDAATHPVAFARTDGDADIRVVLATPSTTDDLCAPVETKGRWSCGTADRAVLNAQNWASGTRAFRDAGGDITSYRHYLVNHEVGHLIGQPHVECPGDGRTAPVMVQQSISLGGCEPNGWPYP